ncbi:MAG: hypothetical protein OJF61_000552 [Rhodanobacteraceae bacterium]|jgi:hypothetical protein|nr:MAG: hypothetical protein OJF61_000552 [Rhodanobacteraceae bacterium]
MNQEPDLVTPPHLQGVLDELRRREPVFHRPGFGTSRADYMRMTTDDFWEIGASGQRYSREFVLDVLEARLTNPVDESDWESRDFHVRELAPGVYLLTYTLRQGERLTRRSTIWRRVGDDWKIVFHQGTVVAPT